MAPSHLASLMSFMVSPSAGEQGGDPLIVLLFVVRIYIAKETGLPGNK